MKKKKMGKLLKFVLFTLTLTICIAAAGGTYIYNNLSKLSEGSEVKDSVIKDDKDIIIEEKEKDSINILALGVDIGDPTTDSEEDPKRTDTMILIHYNPTNESVNVVSIPRDTLIRINKKDYKINAAHAVGGITYAIESVEKLLDIEIDYYGKVNYEGFRQIIDSIGGVDMKISRNMNYDDDSQNLHIHFKKGETVRLDGKKAEEFFRWRKNNNGTGLAEGDLGRIENQHMFIQKVVEKLKSPKIIPRIPAIFMTLPKYCETNMSADEIIKYGYDFVKVSQVKMYTLKGESQYIDGISYFLYDKKLNKEILDTLHDRKIAKGNIDINKSDIKIKVLNGTKINGLAAGYREYLKKKGYKNIIVANGEASDSTKLFLKGFSKDEIEYISDDFDVKKLEIIDDSSSKFDIIVVLGKNYANNQ